jgi:hypothetical protein
MPKHFPISIVAFLVFSATLTSAQAPNTLGFQGRLTDTGGTPINATGQSVTFALYKGATKVWQETQYVDVVDGVFSALLGKITPLDTVRFNEAIDLGIKVGADPEMSPRTPLAGVAHARALPGLYTYFAEDADYESYNVVGGADVNIVGPGSVGATISGGGGTQSSGSIGNVVNGKFGTIGGGQSNYAWDWGTVGGGRGNEAYWHASIGGGALNLAYGQFATVPGGEGNAAMGSHSFAAGYHAVTEYEGTFVWNDRSVVGGSDSLMSTGPNQFIVRAGSGVGINKAPGNVGLHLKQNADGPTGGIRLEYSDDGDYWETWIDHADDYNFAYNGTLRGFIRDNDGEYIVASDARLKEDVRDYDAVLDNVLQLHPSTYRLIDADDAAPRSVGLIAQEVEAYFPELIDEKDGMKGMNYMALSVVAIKAIQELHAIVEAQEERLERQEDEIARLRRLADSR